MKNQIARWMSGMAFLATFMLVFTQCEMGRSETIPENNFDISTRGDVTPPEVCACLTANFALEELSEEETTALIFMREEEKLARDIYLGLHEQWSLPIFKNIARSEQFHMDAILCLLNKYELTDPVGENGIGVFSNADLQALYETLKDRGAESLNAALNVGATIEDVDIRDLMATVENPGIDNEDILAVFGTLTKGSRNHLRAFTGQLKNAGLTYQAQYLGQNVIDEIIAAEWERGNGICGPCTGTGPGVGVRNQNSNTCIYNGTGRRGPARAQGTFRNNCIYQNKRTNSGGN